MSVGLGLVRRTLLAACICALAGQTAAASAKPGFVKAMVARVPFSPIEGVPPATPAEVLLRDLNGSVLEEYVSSTLVEIHEDDVPVLRQRAHSYNVEISVREDFNHIQVAGRILDARDGSGAIPPGQNADPPYPAGVEGMWILQFIGPIKAEWRTELESRGVVIVQYVPYNAFIVAATNDEMETVAALRIVQWTLQMHRFVKIVHPRPHQRVDVHARIFLGKTAQTEQAVALIAERSRVPLQRLRDYDGTVDLFGVFRPDDYDAIVMQPLVWTFVWWYAESDAANIPTASSTGLLLLAGAVTVAALIRLRS